MRQRQEAEKTILCCSRIMAPRIPFSMLPGNRRPAGGIGRDADVCAACDKKVVFYYLVGNMKQVDCHCPLCGAAMRLAGFRSWEREGPPADGNLPDA